MDSSLTIRPATESDVPLVLEFIRELAVYEKLLDRVEANEARLREALFGTTPVASCVLAYQAELPVAFALYYFTYSTFAGLPGLYLEDLFVKPDFRGQGLGHALLQHLAKLAKDRGCWGIYWAVVDWNQSAIRFYEKLGAIPMNDWAVYRLSGAALSKLADEKN